MWQCTQRFNNDPSDVLFLLYFSFCFLYILSDLCLRKKDTIFKPIKICQTRGECCLLRVEILHTYNYENDRSIRFFFIQYRVKSICLRFHFVPFSILRNSHLFPLKFSVIFFVSSFRLSFL